jgi:hypothetical protein
VRILAVSPVDEKADSAEQQIWHADHQVDALVIRARLTHRVVFVLRTGGSDGFLSRRAGAGGARQTKPDEECQERDK